MSNLLTATTLFHGLLSRRVDAFLSDAELADEARASLAIKSLEFYRLERKIITSDRNAPADAPDPLQKHIVKRFDQACDYIDATSDEKERSYLRRLLVEEAVKLSSLRGEFYLESALDATLDQIDDDEERQKAVCACAKFYARRLAFHPDENERGRVKLNLWIDDADDLNDYEELIAEATASAFFGLIPDFSDPLSVMKSIEGVERLRKKVSQFETFEAKLKLNDEIPTQLVEELNVPIFAELLRYQAFQTVKTLYELSDSIENRRSSDSEDDESEELDEDDVQELRLVARNFVPRSPFVLEHCDKLRPFLILYRSLNAFEPILLRIREALETLEDDENDPKIELKKACYKRDKQFYEKELSDYILASVFLVSKVDPDDYLEKARSIALQARLAFVYDSENVNAAGLARKAVIESLDVVPKIENVCDRIACWRMLAEAHFNGKSRRPLAKFASLIEEEIDSIESELTRDNEKSKAFPILADIYDSDRIMEFAQTFKSAPQRVEHVAKAKIRNALKDVQKDQDGRKYRDALADCACDLLEDVKEFDPLIATEVFLQVSRFLNERLEFLLNPEKIRIPKFC